MARKNLKPLKIIIPGVIGFGFLTWLIITLFTMSVDITANSTYILPEFTKLSELSTLNSGEFAVAVDGAIAFENTTESPRPTASTAKMILALAVMEQKPFELGTPGETITINQEMYDRYVWYVNNYGSYSPVYVGQEISQYDALMTTLLISSNNMADSLAIWAFGSLANYREFISVKLAEWGIKDTVIGDDASGYSATTTSTPAALARIGHRLMQNPVLREIVGTKNYTLPNGTVLTNSNRLLGEHRIAGIKTGWIGDASGFCLVSGYLEDEHIVTVALLNTPTRESSFHVTSEIVTKLQAELTKQKIISAGDIIGYYESWWSGKTPIVANEDLSVLGFDAADKSVTLDMDGDTGTLSIVIGNTIYNIGVSAKDYRASPTFFERLTHAFGWTNTTELEIPAVGDQDSSSEGDPQSHQNPERVTPLEGDPQRAQASAEHDGGGSGGRTRSAIDESFTNAKSANCTIKYGRLMLINPNFTVEQNFIAKRRTELVSIYQKYGIVEGNPGNGDNLLDAEAAVHINDMVKAYEAAYPGHTLETRSCFRSVGTNCGRLCYATGTSDHHTGLTCDLLDPAYGTSLDTSTYERHIDWQWLRANSYKYGFIDRFPEHWAGGPMSEPVNVDANGSTGLFETWHYRYVGIEAATEIATGKYNNGTYDSLEHYLKVKGLVTDLKNAKCAIME